MINDSAACSADSLLLSRQRQRHAVRKTQTDSEKHTNIQTDRHTDTQ